MAGNNDELDNWEALFDHKYLRHFNLMGEPALVEIVKVQAKVELTLPGGAKAKKPVVHFKLVRGRIERVPLEPGSKADIKPLVLNTTNGNSIAEALGVKPSTWIGKCIVLFPDETRMYDDKTKKMVLKPCIRIRAQAPATTPAKKPDAAASPPAAAEQQPSGATEPAKEST